MSYQTVVKFHMLLTKMCSGVMCLRLMENYDKIFAMVASAVFNTRQHFPSGRKF